MNITFTDAAVAIISPYMEQGGLHLKLLYDTEGCGCVVSGVPALQLVKEIGPDDRIGNGNPFQFLYEPRFEVFFEPQLKVDYDLSRDAFILKSDNQIYTNGLRLIKPAG
ncbi:iron-sulfur cluster biosynthesis family protein [Paenibacillus tarimensis]